MRPFSSYINQGYSVAFFREHYSVIVFVILSILINTLIKSVKWPRVCYFSVFFFAHCK